MLIKNHKECFSNMIINDKRLNVDFFPSVQFISIYFNHCIYGYVLTE